MIKAIMWISIFIFNFEVVLAQDFLVSSNGAGEFQIGKSVYGILFKYKDDERIVNIVRRRVGDNEFVVTEVRLDGKNISLELETIRVDTPAGDSDETIESIKVFDPRFKTERQVGVGSTLFEVRKSYPDLRVYPVGKSFEAEIPNLNIVLGLKEKVLFKISRENTEEMVEDAEVAFVLIKRSQ